MDHIDTDDSDDDFDDGYINTTVETTFWYYM